MDWLKAIISFLLAILIVGIGSLLTTLVTEQIYGFSSYAGSHSTNVTSFLTNLAQYVLTIFGIFIVSPLIYILLGKRRKPFQPGGYYYEN